MRFFLKNILIFSITLFTLVIFISPSLVWADTYQTNGIFHSANILPVDLTSTVLIQNFIYTASVIPIGTSIKIQFSKDDPSSDYRRWSDSGGSIDTWTMLSAGTNSIDLSGLAWNTSRLYYRVWFISDGTATPVLDAVNLAYITGATYPLGGLLTSTNIMPANTPATINTFTYNASAIPSGTSLQIQFSYDNTSWYSALGVSRERTDLITGFNSINLSGLAWTKAAFYYRVWFVSDGTSTPIFDSSSVSVSLLGGINDGPYQAEGVITSTNILSSDLVESVFVQSVSYNALAIPIGTGMKIQFSRDDLTSDYLRWYDSGGNLDGWDTMSAGTISIDISRLGWITAKFYYRVVFTSNSIFTPVLESVGVNYVEDATYTLGGLLTSTNILPTNSPSAINTFSYNASAIPDGTNLQIQFSYDNTNWYSATGVANERTNLEEGVNSLDLSTLAWTKTAFYYRVWFISDGISTPIFDSSSVAVSLLGGINDGPYQNIGIITSTNALEGTDSLQVKSVNYNAFAIPAGTSLTIQFSNDNVRWFDALGVENSSSTLLVGENTIDLSTLNWVYPFFYYQVWFRSDGPLTPVLNYISVNASVSSANTIPGGYVASGTLTSNNLLPEDKLSTINSLEYNVSSLPVNTSLKLQFSRSGTQWYDSAGTLNASNTLSVGTSTIDLSELDWAGYKFYYKASFYGDGTGSPILNSVSLNHTPILGTIPTVVVGKQGRQIATTTATSTNQDLGGAFTLTTTDSSIVLNSIKLKKLGSFSITDIENIRLYSASANVNGLCEATKPASGAVEFDSISSFDNDGTITASSTLALLATTTCIYVVYDLSGETSIATLGRSIEFEITNPSTDVVVTGGVVNGTDPVNIPRATIVIMNNAGDSSADSIESLISINTSDPDKNPTVFYLQDNKIWKKEGDGEPMRMTNPNLQVHSLIFRDMSGNSSDMRVFTADITISNMDPGNEEVFMNVTRTLHGAFMVMVPRTD